MPNNITNAMTVDVEDYFQVSAFETHILRQDWDKLPCRIEGNIDRLLSLFSERGARATFFTLGWIAQRYPVLIREIIAQGHEIASHGYEHVRVTDQSPEQFKDDVISTKKLLEDTTGVAVKGFRAASFSIGSGNLWALDTLAEAGYEYSSSIYPIQHDHYGMPEAPRFCFRYKESGILEIPVTTIEMAGRRYPCGGGGFFRLFPYILSRWAISRVNGQDRQPALFYFHPWEIDPGQPRQHGLPLKTRFRHYVNLHRMQGKVDRLLRDFHWGRMDEVFLAPSDPVSDYQ